MGIDISNDTTNNKVVIKGKGLKGLNKPSSVIDVGNSGTTMRLLSGILCGQTFDSVLTGDESIRSRPMDRIIIPLSKMGAKIKSKSGDGLPPLEIYSRGETPLKGITYNSPVASAQVKSSILLAGLYADKETKVIEPNLSRNHTEITLNYFGAILTRKEILLHSSQNLPLRAKKLRFLAISHLLHTLLLLDLLFLGQNSL